jgi:hypothetical protein
MRILGKEYQTTGAAGEMQHTIPLFELQLAMVGRLRFQAGTFTSGKTQIATDCFNL